MIPLHMLLFIVVAIGLPFSVASVITVALLWHRPPDPIEQRQQPPIGPASGRLLP